MKVKSNLDVIIYEHILDALISGDYSMGQTVLIDELANKYEVSRTPVTQAVRLLANDGILEVMNNGRASVPVFNQEQMKKICELRLLLENFAIDKIQESQESKAELYDSLAEIAEKGLKALKAGDKLKFNRWDLAFHSTLIAGADNEYLANVYKRVQGKFIVANYLISPLQERSFDKAADSHVQIAERLRNHDTQGCKKLLEEHIFVLSTVISASF